MNTRLATLLAAIAAVGSPIAASAQDSELEARVDALESLVLQLQAELAAAREERSDTDDDLIRLENMATSAQEAVDELRESTAVTMPAGNGFQVGDTRLAIGGFADFDAHVTHFSDGSVASGSVARDFHIPGATPVGGGEESTTTDFTAESTRFFMTANRNVNGEDVSARVELDFLLSAQGNERVSNSFAPRLRLAYLNALGLRIGQDWSTFQNTSAIPESASFLTLSDGMVFVRQPLVRYTNGPWQVALENGDTTFTPVGGGRIEADTNTVPDGVVRYNHAGDFGNVSVAVLARQLRADIAGVDDDAFGYGVSVSGRVNVGERDDVRFSLSGGEGMGRYIGLNAVNAAVVDPLTGDLEPITSYGGLLAYRHRFGETGRINVGASGLFADNPSFAPGSSTSEVYSGYVALLGDIAPRVTMGAEVLYGQRETEAGADGDILRLTFSSRYSF